MKRKNRKLYTLLLLFALTLIAGIVYAATSGVLTFGGTVNFGDTVELAIVDLTDSGPTDANSTIKVNKIDNQTVEFTVSLAAPGDEVSMSFFVENIGTLPATVKDYDLTFDGSDDLDGLPFVIGGDFTDVIDEVIAVGDTYPGLFAMDITFKRLDNYVKEIKDEYNVKLSLNYEQATN